MLTIFKLLQNGITNAEDTHKAGEFHDTFLSPMTTARCQKRKRRLTEIELAYTILQRANATSVGMWYVVSRS